MKRQQAINYQAVDPTLSPGTVNRTGQEILKRHHLDQLVNALPGRQQEVTVLHIYEDLTLQEVAAVLGIPLGTVKSNYHKALVNLRQKFAEVPGRQ